MVGESCIGSNQRVDLDKQTDNSWLTRCANDHWGEQTFETWCSARNTPMVSLCVHTEGGKLQLTVAPNTPGQYLIEWYSCTFIGNLKYN